LDGLTRSSSERARNDAARASVLVALLGLAVPVVAFAAAHRLDQVSLLQATAATCGSVVLGAAAVLLARRGLRNIERTIGRTGGEGTARVGRLLGAIAFCLGITAGIALGVYALLNLFG
jgi:peptidoglycan/LPS O-acetylase OafA/YrhL